MENDLSNRNRKIYKYIPVYLPCMYTCIHRVKTSRKPKPSSDLIDTMCCAQLLLNCLFVKIHRMNIERI